VKGRIKNKNLKCQHILSVVGQKEIEIHRKKEEKNHPDIKNKDKRKKNLEYKKRMEDNKRHKCEK
jgi:hypothetical protein